MSSYFGPPRAGAKGQSDNDKPTLTMSLPPADKATGAAVVICPGGGYGGLAMGYEGIEVGEWFNSFGVAAFVLKYRHRGTGYGHPAPLEDCATGHPHGARLSGAWKIDPSHIGIMGFSAGAGIWPQ